MHLSEIHRHTRLVVSFELFPPKTPETEAVLFERELPALAALKPAFITCTYGAGGSTRGKTLDVVSHVRNTLHVETAAHLTCVGASREELGDYLVKTRDAGITNIVALRGDPPRDDDTFRPHPDGFRYACELVAFIKATNGFDVAVAGYPEGHPECPDKHTDWKHTADKVAAGADVIITQLYYDNRDFFAFRDYLRDRLGVRVPIVAGMLPILNAAQIKRFCGLCGATLPPRVLERLDRYADDNEACRRYGVELATEMCEELIREDAEGIHFYVLNRSQSVSEILANLKLDRPRTDV